MKNPYLAYAQMAQIMDTTPAPAQDIHPSAVIAADAKLGNNVSIGANAVIESGVELGNNVVIGAGCFIGKKHISAIIAVCGQMSLFIMKLSLVKIV